MRKQILCALLMLAAVIPLSAKKKGGNEIILVGKVTVVSNLNMDFLAKSHRVTQEEQQSPGTYTAPRFNSNTDTKMNWKGYTYMIPEKLDEHFTNGEYFCMKYRFPERRSVDLRYLTYYFFNTAKVRMTLPMSIHVAVPEGAQALYIGDFTYTVEGDEFDVTGMKVSYSLADAQAALDAATGMQYELQKADWNYKNALSVDYKHITGTPADSVVFYGGFTANPSGDLPYIFSYIFSEVSPIQLYPDQALSGTEFFISSPVRPGSTYIMRYWNTPRDYAVTFTEEDSLLTVNVPKEPGLYFFGCYDAKKSLEKGTLKELGNSARWNKRILVEALRRYKGTVWEEYIRAELDKL